MLEKIIDPILPNFIGSYNDINLVLLIIFQIESAEINCLSKEPSNYPRRLDLLVLSLLYSLFCA